MTKSLNMDLEGNASEAIFSDSELQAMSGPSDRDLDDLQQKSEGIVTAVGQEATELKNVADSFRSGGSKGISKDQTNALLSLSDFANQVVTDAKDLHRRILTYSQTARLHRERQQIAMRQLEGVLQACLADNNMTRRRFGLEEVTLSSFSATVSALSVHNSDAEKSSITASTREVFFDAETWEANEEDEEESGDEHEQGYESPEDFDEEDEQSLGSTPAHSREPSGKEPTGKMSPDQHGVLILESSAEVLPEQNQGPANIESTPKVIVRRTKLPAPTVSMQNISLMSILRNNMGKDLSTVAMPIALNEPINLLQKLCEELEYSELLDRAAKTTDTVERLCLVAAFSISAYSSTINRVGRKPFNPLLGETYECLREDKGFKFVSEKVSHHPPVMACYAESPNYVFFQESLVKSKFWGKSMELIPSGTVHVAFPKLNEHYTWGKVTTCMRNIFSTSRYLEHYGTMKIMAHGSGHYCEITFKESGYFSSAKNEIAGAIYGPSGQKLMSLSGQWDKSIQKFHESAPNTLEVLWRARPCPPHHADMYGFTQFTAELNELTPDLEGVLPNTDTRYRPDQRMYEEINLDITSVQGRADEAEQEKSRLEQKQREYRKQLETEGRAWTPQWFEFKPTAYGDDAESWQYKGGYFEHRGKFEKKIDLW
ncbi:Oxysterol-binding protein- protein 3 [Rhizophlyctis rosea]|nr:Oxysterol-binding protein- protein 3 [Rhizophlyctis rosea]